LFPSVGRFIPWVYSEIEHPAARDRMAGMTMTMAMAAMRACREQRALGERPAGE
jgi:hypothetical protein